MQWHWCVDVPVVWSLYLKSLSGSVTQFRAFVAFTAFSVFTARLSQSFVRLFSVHFTSGGFPANRLRHRIDECLKPSNQSNAASTLPMR